MNITSPKKRNRIVKTPTQFLGLLLGSVILRKVIEKYRVNTIRMDKPSTGLERYEARLARQEEQRRREQNQFIIT